MTPDLDQLHTEDPDEIAAILEIMDMPPAKLEAVPFEVVHWRCKVRLCKCYTRARDYGCGPYFFHPRFGWFNQVRQFFMCGKHNKAFRTRWGKDWDRVPLRKYWGGDDTAKPIIIY